MSLFEDVRGPVLTSTEVADRFDCTTESARQKLRRLEDQGRVESKSPGRDVIYWRSTDEPATEPSRRNVRREPTMPTSEVEDPDTTEASEPAVTQHDTDKVREVAGVRVNLPGSGERLDRRFEVLEKIVEFLEHNGPAQKSEIEDEFYDQNTVGYSSASSWWENFVWRGLQQLAEGSNEFRKAGAGNSPGWDYVERSDSGSENA